MEIKDNIIFILLVLKNIEKIYLDKLRIGNKS